MNKLPQVIVMAIPEGNTIKENTDNSNDWSLELQKEQWEERFPERELFKSDLKSLCWVWPQVWVSLAMSLIAKP